MTSYVNIKIFISFGGSLNMQIGMWFDWELSGSFLDFTQVLATCGDVFSNRIYLKCLKQRQRSQYNVIFETFCSLLPNVVSPLQQYFSWTYCIALIPCGPGTSLCMTYCKLPQLLHRTSKNMYINVCANVCLHTYIQYVLVCVFVQKPVVVQELLHKHFCFQFL